MRARSARSSPTWRWAGRRTTTSASCRWPALGTRPSAKRPARCGAAGENDRVYWILFYDLVDDYLERRQQFRDDHLGRARAAHERGELVMAGALADPADGAVLVFRADSPAVAEAFAA